MLTAIILLATVPGWSTAQDGEVLLPDNKTQCAIDMVQWCNKMQYADGAGMTMESVTYEDPAGSYKVFCSSDSDGTACTKNGFPWFSCSPNKQLPPGNTFIYKGQVLTANISSNVSANLVDICADADRALNDIFVQNLSYQNETLKEEVQQTFEAMFQQMSDMSDQMEQMQAQLDLLSLFFKRDLVDGPKGGVPLQSQTDTTTLSPSNTATLYPGNMTTLSPSNMTTLSPSNMTTLSPSNMTTLSSSNMTTLPPSNMTTLSPSNMTTLSPSNMTTLSTSNKTTLSPSNSSALNSKELTNAIQVD